MAPPTALRALDAAHGGGYFPLDEETETDEEAAAAAFSGQAPVDRRPDALHRPDPLGPAQRRGAGRVPENGGRRRWGSGVDPRLIDAAEWATLVFGTSETAVALLTSTPGSVDDNVLTNPQIAAARDIMARYGAVEGGC